MTPYTSVDPTVDEPEKQECPYCHAHYTKFQRYEQDSGCNSVEVYVCHTCSTTFKIKAKEIPF